MRVADYSWSRPSPAVLKNAGFIGAIRYLGPGNGGRDITAAEVRSLHAGGLGVGLVWETTTTAALAGFQAGYADVTQANRYADAIGYPNHLPIFYAVDTDVTAAAIRGPVADTFRGAIRASKRPVRPYGEHEVLEILCGDLKLMPCGWQCAAWSRGRLSRYRCMFQLYPPIMSESVDVNELGPMPIDFLWHPTIRYDAMIGAGEETHMPLNADDLAQVRTAVKDMVIEVMAGSVRDLAEAIQRIDTKVGYLTTMPAPVGVDPVAFTTAVTSATVAAVAARDEILAAIRSGAPAGGDPAVFVDAVADGLAERLKE